MNVEKFGRLALLPLLNKRVQLRSFIMMDQLADFNALLAELDQFVGDNELVSVTHIVDGLANAPMALNHFIEGTNTGKLCVRIHD